MDKYRVILHNDDHHPMLYVISCLIKVCEHKLEQAEQCALITHHNKKCDIYSGDILDAKSVTERLTGLGLNVKMEQICV